MGGELALAAKDLGVPGPVAGASEGRRGAGLEEQNQGVPTE